MHPFFLFILKYSYFGIFTALGLGILGLSIPDETLMALIGFLAFKGDLTFVHAVIAHLPDRFAVFHSAMSLAEASGILFWRNTHQG